MSALTVRKAGRDDAAAITRLIHAHAAYEGAPQACRATVEDIERDGFGARPRFEVLLCEHGGRAVGMAMFFEAFSSWEGRTIVFLEDLFVEDAARGLGAGRRLMQAVAAETVRRGCPRLDWLVSHDNPARDFYAHLGADHMDDWHFYRLHGKALTDLAES